MIHSFRRGTDEAFGLPPHRGKASTVRNAVPLLATVGLSLLLTGVVTLGVPKERAEAAFPGASGKIAFVGTGEIYKMNPDGTVVRRLTNNSVADYSPSWSPDGNKIAYVRNGARGAEIYKMNSDG